MRALVTGGGGFLGGAIVRQLIRRGDAVRSFSRGSYPELDRLGVEHVQGDLADLDDICAAVKGCDVVFHVAAKAGPWGPYREYYQANVEGTRNVIAACKKTGVRRLVYTSSPSVVFNGGDMEGVDESVSYGEHFESAYPATKAIAEALVLEANDSAMATVALRPHLIWGPGDNNLIPRLISKARAGRLRIVGTGENKVDVVFVDNAAKAHLQAADHLRPGSPVAGKAYFISNGDPRPIAEVLDRIMEIYQLPPVTKKLKCPAAIAYAGGWVFEKLYNAIGLKSEPLVTRFLARELSTSHWFDISAARNDFGYHPEISFEEGLNLLRESIA
ncbi:MAG: NAD-dependent epimerase/dehydratase family protein [Spirochaetes bacterium]|nr:NAD-dependent epimerase/dehydratase family protein [Spirochaetota bacterium]